MCQPYPIQQLHGAGARFAALQAADLGRGQDDVVEHRQMRKQIETLEHKPHTAAQPVDVGVGAVDVTAVKQDLALLHVLKTIDGADQRRLARA